MKHILMRNCMKSLVLRSRILWSYVPLRTSSKRKRVANEICFLLPINTLIVQIDEVNL
jgi:hypothetical protein